MKLYSSQDACAIAGVDRHKLEEEICAGIYKCAPICDAGVARMYSEDSLVVLCAYAIMQRFGIKKAHAAEIAVHVFHEVKKGSEFASFDAAGCILFQINIAAIRNRINNFR